jgi:hypothetical protein
MLRLLSVRECPQDKSVNDDRHDTAVSARVTPQVRLTCGNGI